MTAIEVLRLSCLIILFFLVSGCFVCSLVVVGRCTGVVYMWWFGVFGTDLHVADFDIDNIDQSILYTAMLAVSRKTWTVSHHRWM